MWARITWARYMLKEGEPVSLKATRDGYHDQSESLLATSNRAVTLELERRRAGARSMAPTRPEPMPPRPWSLRGGPPPCPP